MFHYFKVHTYPIIRPVRPYKVPGNRSWCWLTYHRYGVYTDPMSDSYYVLEVYPEAHRAFLVGHVDSDETYIELPQTEASIDTSRTTFHDWKEWYEFFKSQQEQSFYLGTDGVFRATSQKNWR